MQERTTPRRILVTGVGGAPGLDLAMELLKLGHEVIGTDSNPLAPGLLTPGIIARTVARADSPDYATDLRQLCADLGVEGLVSTVEHELPPLIAIQEELKGLGVSTLLPPPAAAEASIDKAAFGQVARKHRIPTPATFLPGEIDQVPGDCQLVVKPRRGQGSKDLYFCSTKAQAKILCELVTDPIVQQRVEGQEFSADCLVDRQGRASVVLRKRLMVHGGLSLVASTFHDDEASARVKDVLAAVGAVGPADVQGFITHDGSDRVVMTEINARFAAGFLLSEAAGADMVRQTVNALFHREVDHDRLRYKPDVYLTKYVAVLSTKSRDVPERV
ncbi:ATP-grasp domain-containing protein [Streptomyces mirabilis]|uniref:ATP-grasp domain-containing protein n=1 Tax=Streptomyces mirabilis TaxID=68239 RepID=UPI0036AAA91D